MFFFFSLGLSTNQQHLGLRGAPRALAILMEPKHDGLETALGKSRPYFGFDVPNEALPSACTTKPDDFKLKPWKTFLHTPAARPALCPAKQWPSSPDVPSLPYFPLSLTPVTN